MTAIGYIRQSRRADQDVALSYPAQEAAIRRMAGKDVEIVSDMGRSGKGGGERLRPGYLGMVARIESGDVDAVYVISLSRLSRSVPELHGFMKMAQAKGCAIVSEKEGRLDPTSASGKLMFNIWASFAEYIRDLQVEGALENAAIRRSRGERMGRVPYGERPGDRPDAVLEAWADSGGSLNGTAFRLNEARIPTWTGKATWTGPAVRLVLQRLQPGILPGRTYRGVKPTSPFMFYRLLRCGGTVNEQNPETGIDEELICGRIMTASRDARPGNRSAWYRCHAADTLPTHSRPYRVRETVVLPWIQAEAARLHLPLDAAEMETGHDAERARLEERRIVIEDMYENNGPNWRDEYIRRMDVLKTDEAALANRVADLAIVSVPGTIDWRWPAKNVNDVLTRMWEYVQLDKDLRPVRAEWRIPAEYVA